MIQFRPFLRPEMTPILRSEFPFARSLPVTIFPLRRTIMLSRAFRLAAVTPTRASPPVTLEASLERTSILSGVEAPAAWVAKTGKKPAPISSEQKKNLVLRWIFKRLLGRVRK